jgi:hypothetical protein
LRSFRLGPGRSKFIQEDRPRVEPNHDVRRRHRRSTSRWGAGRPRRVTGNGDRGSDSQEAVEEEQCPGCRGASGTGFDPRLPGMREGDLGLSRGSPAGAAVPRRGGVTCNAAPLRGTGDRLGTFEIRPTPPNRRQTTRFRRRSIDLSSTADPGRLLSTCSARADPNDAPPLSRPAAYHAAMIGTAPARPDRHGARRRRYDRSRWMCSIINSFPNT